MKKTFAIARPSKTRFRQRVFDYLMSMGFEMARGGLLPPGTPDEHASRWVDRLDVDLIVLPFHLHRSKEGAPLDAVGLALSLPARFDEGHSPILMPVSNFSWESSYERRVALLKKERPRLAKRIVTLREQDIGSPQIARLLGRAKKSSPTADVTSGARRILAGYFPESSGRDVQPFSTTVTTARHASKRRAVSEYPTSGRFQRRTSTDSLRSATPSLRPSTRRLTSEVNDNAPPSRRKFSKKQ